MPREAPRSEAVHVCEMGRNEMWGGEKKVLMSYSHLSPDADATSVSFAARIFSVNEAAAPWSVLCFTVVDTSG